MKTDRRELWLAVALTFAAAVFRPLDVLGRSMWLDEGSTLLRIAGSWVSILSNTIDLQGVPMFDTHPPGYFLLMKAWAMLAGETEFALKWVSVIGGVLAVPLIYVLARRLFTRRVAVIAATMMLISPLLEWYAHEMRMYTVLVCLSAFSTYLLYCALYPVRNKDLTTGWIAWAISIAVACASHYPFGGLLVTHAIVAAVTIWRRPQKLHRLELRVLLQLAAAGIFILLAFYLWPPTHELFTRLTSGSERDYTFVPLDIIVQSILNGYILGVNANDYTGLLAWVLGLLCLLGFLLPLDGSTGDKSTRPARVLTMAAAIGPTLVWFAISFFKPNFQGVRHLILVVPALGVLLANGVSQILDWRPLPWQVWRHSGRIIGLVSALVLLASEIYGSAFVFIHTPDWQDDWRGMADYVRNNWQEGDVFVINSPLTAGTLTFYVPDLDSVVSPPTKYSADSDEALQQRQELLANHKRIWFTNTGTGDGRDGGLTMAYFVDHAFHREKVGFPTRTRFIDVDLFDVASPVTDLLPPTAQAIADIPPSATGAYIAGYEIKAPNLHNPHPNMWLSLYWKRIDASNVDAHSASVRFSDPNHVAWADWYMPANLNVAPASWTVGRLYRVDYLVPLPLGLPSQPYNLEITSQAGEKGELIQHSVNPLSPAQVDCCVRIKAWPALPLAEQHDVWQTRNATLMKAEFLADVKPGEYLPVALTWRIDSAGAPAWQTRVSLEPLLPGAAIAETDKSNPTGLFQLKPPIGEPVRELQSLQMPYNTVPGFYRLMLTRYYADNQNRDDGLILGIVKVSDYAPSPLAAQPEYSVTAQVGDFRLLGYSLMQPISRTVVLNFHTYWTVMSKPTRDGVLFLHLLSASGKPIAQDDNMPEQGLRSTVTYHPGDGIDQVHRLIIPADAPGGDYKLYAGVYDRSNLIRWQAQQNGAQAQDDLVYLGSINLPDLPAMYRVFLPRVNTP